MQTMAIFIFCIKGSFYANTGLLHQGKIYAKSALLYSKGGFYASDFAIKLPRVYQVHYKVNSYKGKIYVRV